MEIRCLLLKLSVWSLCFLCAMLPAQGVNADITTDGSLGPAGPLAGPDFVIPPEVGRLIGGNLFHSFGMFDIYAGESATFTGPDTVDNIISRVTGGSASLINGPLSSTIPGADLFFLNPSGVIFGPDASLHIPGSFHVSTAHYLLLEDGGRFDAASPSDSLLSVAAPSAFGFISDEAAPISVQGALLELPEGESLSLTGGDLSIESGNLYASSGSIGLVAVASAGEVRLTGNGPVADSFGLLGNIWISEARSDAVMPRYAFDSDYIVANVDASSSPGSESGAGSIYIRGRNFMVDRGYIFNDTYGGGSGGGIDIRSSQSVTLTNSSILTSETAGGGHAGIISIETDNLTVAGGSWMSSSSRSSGTGGDMIVRAGSVMLEGIDDSGNNSGLFSSARGTGDGGNISIHAGELALEDNALIHALTTDEGNAGSVDLEVGSLTITGGGQIDVGTRSGSTGDGGNLTINAAGAVTVSGFDETETFPSAIFSDTLGSGDGGNISISAGSLRMEDGGRIDASTAGDGDVGDVVIDTGSLILLGGGRIDMTSRDGAAGSAGNLTIDAAGDIVIAGQDFEGNNSGLFSNARGTGAGGSLFVTASDLTLDDVGLIHSLTLGEGNAGSVDLEVGSLTITGGGQIDVGTRSGSTGDGGNLTINAAGAVTVSGFDETETFPSAIFSNSRGEGSGGGISISAGILSIEDGGRIDASTARGGEAGSIVLTVSEFVSRGGLTQSLTSSAGNAGDIVVRAENITLLDGAVIRVNSEEGASGNGGTLEINAEGTLLITGTDGDGDSSGLFSNADGSGDGGSMSITAGSVFLGEGGSIDASTSASGHAGSIFLDVGTYVSRGGLIQSLTSAGGDAGDIVIEADDFALLDGAQVKVDSEEGAAGSGGHLRIDATGTVLISGTDKGGDNSGMFSNASGEGDGGDITITASDLIIEKVGLLHSLSRGGGDAGEVMVNVDSLIITEGGQIDVGTRPGSTGDGGNLGITASAMILVSGIDETDTYPSAIFSDTAGSGSGGSIGITAPRVMVEGDGKIDASTSMAGDAGSIRIDAGSLELLGGGRLETSSDDGATGSGGNVQITAGTLIISSHDDNGRNSGLFSSANGAGDGGHVSVTAGDIYIEDVGLLHSLTTGTGDAGEVMIDTANLFISGGGQVDVGTRSGSTGNGGDLVINASGTVLVTGRDESNTFPSAIFSDTLGSGNGGNISISASDIVLSERGLIDASTSLTGNAGDVIIVARNLDVLSGGQILVSSIEGASGAGGNLDVTARQVSVSGEHESGTNSGLFSSTGGEGDGGSISITAGNMSLSDIGLIHSLTTGAGDAGNVLFEVGTMEISGGGQIDVGTREGSTGDGGALEIIASRSLSIAGRDVTDVYPSAIFSDTLGDGDGGSITIETPLLVMSDRGLIDASTRGIGRGGGIMISTDVTRLSENSRITAQSTGSGNAGSIVIRAGEVLHSESGSITTQANQAAGGNIDIVGGDVILTKNSEITASVASGEGGGGNVTIHADSLAAIEDSDITARADQGFGGDITIQSGVVLFSDDSDLDASSNVAGREGTISVSSPVVDITGGLIALPASFLDAESLLPAQCQTQDPELQSSFVVTGKGIHGRDPDELLIGR